MYVVVFFFALLLANPHLQVAGCQSEAAETHVEKICVSPQNSLKLVVAGEHTELLAGLENVEGSPLNITAIQASVHCPYDHQILVQNLKVQPGTCYHPGTVFPHIDLNTFHNATVEVVKACGPICVKSFFHVTLGVALLLLLCLWLGGQFQHLTKDEANGEYHVDVDDEEEDYDDLEIADDWLGGGFCTECNRINGHVFVCSETGCKVSFHKECMTWKLDSDDMDKFYCRGCLYKQEGAGCKESKTLSKEQNISTTHGFDNVGHLESIKDVAEVETENSERVILSAADEGSICGADAPDVGVDTNKLKKPNLCWAGADHIIVLDVEDEIENGEGTISSAADEGTICVADGPDVRVDTKKPKKPTLCWAEAEILVLDGEDGIENQEGTILSAVDERSNCEADGVNVGGGGMNHAEKRRRDAESMLLEEESICGADGIDVGDGKIRPAKIRRRLNKRSENMLLEEGSINVVDGEMMLGDLQSSSEIRPVKMRRNPNLRWTEAEVELLEELVRSVSTETKKISWDKVLERGRSGFHPSRTKEGLAQKWRKIKEANVR